MASREGIPPLSFPSFRFQVARIRYFVVTRVIAFSRALLGWTPREWFDATFLENGLSIDYNGGSFLSFDTFNFRKFWKLDLDLEDPRTWSNVLNYARETSLHENTWMVKNFWVTNFSVSQCLCTTVLYSITERRSKNLMKSHGGETGKPPTGPGR